MKTVSRLLIVVALSVLSFASEIQGPAKTFGEFGWSIAVSGNTLAISRDLMILSVRSYMCTRENLEVVGTRLYWLLSYLPTTVLWDLIVHFLR